MTKTRLFAGMLKSALKYGLIGALIAFAYSQFLVQSGIVFIDGLGMYMGYLGIIIMPIFTYMAIQEFLRKTEIAKIKLHHALLIGLATSVIAAIFFSFGSLIVANVFDNAYQEAIIERTKKAMIEAGSTTGEIEDRIVAIREKGKSFTPHLNRFKWYVGLGFIYSLGSFVILRFIVKPK